MKETTPKPGFLITILLLVFTSLSSMLSFGQDKGTFTDKRDGHVYRWVIFGKHAWMLGNLDYKTPAGSWIYNNDSTREAAYGRLYDWTTAQKACPKGWNMPTDDEWSVLITALGGEDVAGRKFQEADTIPAAVRIIKNGNTDNSIAVLAGMRHADGSYTGLGLWGGCWSATNTSTKDGNNYLFTHNGGPVGKSTNDKASAFSVRCIRNK